MKYIFTLIIILTLIIVGITVGANNDQLININYVFAKSEIRLSTLVALLFGFGFLLGWLTTGVLYLRLKFKNASLNHQLKRQNKQINELENRNKVA
ncbi:hypothetical protein CEP45_04825 [Mergibacter septicus]|uniref:LapA family protein n=1 Tax=Mergibacter septicus TaxID=221402 RepID=UPI0011796E0D|nr:lipopolysaccharide assembly protein LapA domain-containing protein [Mergibacter septicus]AWX13733.1 hypothetical protein CEP49_03785 [Mergibacter septicus]QDJ13212.1 hypothetical protein CEP45_04825 [Mergibacter septicus]